MKKTFLPSLFIIFLSTLFICLFNACTDSDDFLYNNDEHPEITMFAQITKSFDSSSVRKKSDTISVGDSIIFTATVLPSKSVRLKSSYWEMDGAFFASEFSVRDAITLPGKHDFVFTLVDVFGDTLRDTVKLWIAEPPILKTTDFIPAYGSQGIPSNKEIQFIWQAYDPSSSLKLHYHFILTSILTKQEEKTNIIDTILENPYFVCNKELAPLSIYQWSVQAYNEYGQPSENKISGQFATKGVAGEAGIFGVFSPSAPSLYADIDLIVLDSNNNPTGYKTSMEKTPSTSIFSINPLPQGSYNVTAQYKKGFDYFADTLPVKLTAGEVTLLDTLHLIDTIPPRISSVTGSDTLDFADSLSFIIEDGDGCNIIQNTAIYIGDRKVTSFREKGNTITFATTSEDSSWFMQVVSVKAKDASGNTTTKDFYVRSTKTWIETNNDTTISVQDTIEVFIKDVNPFGFKPHFFTIKVNDNNRFVPTIVPYDDPKMVRYTLNGNSFGGQKQKITVGVTYENNIVQTRSWNLTLNNPPRLTVDDGLTEEVTASTELIVLWWHKAQDDENDPILYRFGYTLTKDETDTSNFIYPKGFTQDTVIELRDLAEGTYYWWVEAKDSYGGTSDPWETRKRFFIQDSEKNQRIRETLMEGDNDI